MTTYPKEVTDEITRLSQLSGVPIEGITQELDKTIATGKQIDIALAQYKDTISFRLGGEATETLARVIGKEPSRTVNPKDYGGVGDPYTFSTLHLFIFAPDESYTLRRVRLYGERAPLIDNYTVDMVVKGAFNLHEDGLKAYLTNELQEVQAEFPPLAQLIGALSPEHANSMVSLQEIQGVVNDKNNHFFVGTCSSPIESKKEPGRIIGFRMSAIGSNPIAVWLPKESPSNFLIDNINEGNITIYGRARTGQDGKININACGIYQ